MKDSARQLAGDIQDLLMRARDLQQTHDQPRCLALAVTHLMRAKRALDTACKYESEKEPN